MDLRFDDAFFASFAFKLHISAAIDVVVNGFAMFLIIRCSGRMMGKYKWFLLNVTVSLRRKPRKENRMSRLVFVGIDHDLSGALLRTDRSVRRTVLPERQNLHKNWTNKVRSMAGRPSGPLVISDPIITLKSGSAS